MLQERRRREWRIELREAALERKTLKERIANLEARLERQQEDHSHALTDARDLFEKTFRALDRKIREATDLANEVERLQAEKRQHMAALEAILAECPELRAGTVFEALEVMIGRANSKAELECDRR